MKNLKAVGVGGGGGGEWGEAVTQQVFKGEEEGKEKGECR